MIEQRRFSLTHVRDAIQQAATEIHSSPVAKEGFTPMTLPPRRVLETAGNEFVYGELYRARKKAAKEGGEFWIEPPTERRSNRQQKTYDEEQVAGILDELREIIRKNIERKGKITHFPKFDQNVLDKAEEILLSPKDQKCDPMSTLGVD